MAPTRSVRRHPGPDSFLAAASTYLEKNEALHNLSLGLADGLAAGRSYGPEPPFLLTVESGDGQVVGTVLCTPPHKLVVSLMDEPSLDAVTDWWLDHVGRPVGVIGPDAQARALATKLAVGGADPEMEMRQGDLVRLHATGASGQGLRERRRSRAQRLDPLVRLRVLLSLHRPLQPYVQRAVQAAWLPLHRRRRRDAIGMSEAPVR